MSDTDKLAIWTTDHDDERKAALPSLAKTAGQAVQVGVDIISQNLQQFLHGFQSVVDAAAMEASSFQVEEIELNLVVNGKGGIELLGKLEGGAEASLKVKLRRKQQ